MAYWADLVLRRCWLARAAGFSASVEKKGAPRWHLGSGLGCGVRLGAEVVADRMEDASEAGIVGRGFTCWLKPVTGERPMDYMPRLLGTGEPFEGVNLPHELCMDG